METTTFSQDNLSVENIPSAAIQADRLKWLSQIRNEEQGDARLLLSGLRRSDAERWEIGIEDARLSPSDPTEILLTFPKPKNHPKDERSTTEYLFDQEAVWLLQAHVFYGGGFCVAPSKHNDYYYPALQMRPNGKKKVINADRLVSGCGPHQDARQLKGGDYHDHTRGNIKPTHEQAVVRQVGRENERSSRKATREDVIAASRQLWMESLLFPLMSDYTGAFSRVYGTLDQRHPLLGQIGS